MSLPERNQANQAPPTLAPTPTPAALLVALRRRLILALSVGFIVATVAAAAAWTMTNSSKQNVRAMVHISSTPNALLSQPVQHAENFQYFQKTQKTLVTSQVVIGAVLKDPQVASLRTIKQQHSPKEWLSEGLVVDFTQGPEILQISLKGEDPDDLIVIVNAVTKQYLEEFVNTEQTKRKARLERLREWLQERIKILAGKQRILGAFASSLGAGTTLNEARIKPLEAAREQLRTRQEERKGLEAKVLRLQRRKAPKTLVPASLVEQEIDADRLVRANRDEVEKAERRIAHVRSTATKEFAEKALRSEGAFTKLKESNAALTQRLATIRPQITERLREKAATALDAEIGDAEGQIAVLTEQEKHWAKTVAELTREKELGGESDFKMLAAARDAEEEEKVVKAITGEIRTLEIDLMAPQRAKVLDEAVVTKAIEGKKRIFITAGAGAAALGLILLGVAWWEFQKRKITSTEEIIHGFGVSLVGTLPVIPWKKRRRIDAASADPAAYGAWNESIDSYRIMLLRQAAGRTVRVVMVTSAMPGEGKSSLSGHLAVSLARGGFRTVLVDTDLRNPTVHRLFGLPRKPGLGEVLNGTIDLPAAVQDTAVPRLSVISAGDLDLTAALCLGQDDLAPLFGRLREGFDFVVIDSPPILPVAGTLHVAACADGVIVSLLRNVSRMPKVAAAVHRLRIMGVPILGAVVNGSDEDVYSSRYHVLASPEEE